VGARAEMLRIRNVPGLLVGQIYQYVDDLDLDAAVDIGSTTTLQGEPHAPVRVVSQFFYRGIGRGDQLRTNYQKPWDDGIQVALFERITHSTPRGGWGPANSGRSVTSETIVVQSFEETDDDGRRSPTSC